LAEEFEILSELEESKQKSEFEHHLLVVRIMHLNWMVITEEFARKVSSLGFI
jgi:hypothetical protein